MYWRSTPDPVRSFAGLAWLYRVYGRNHGNPENGARMHGVDLERLVRALMLILCSVPKVLSLNTRYNR